MRNSFALVLCSLACVFLFAGESPADHYWVSFSGTGNVFKYLMQIDENGNITVPATAVLDWANPNSGEPVNPFGEFGQPLAGTTVTALSNHGTGKIKMWITRPDSHLSSLIINKSPLHVDSFKKNENNAFFADVFWSLQSTQRATNNFLAIVRGSKSIYQNDSVWRGSLKGFMLTSSNTYTGTNTRLAPRTDGHNKIGSVSADGLMAITSVEQSNFDDSGGTFIGGNFVTFDDVADKIYAQALTSNATPSSDPFVIGSTGDQVGAVDVSNPIGTHRLAVYATRNTDGIASPILDSSNEDNLVVQKIDAVTGKKIEAPKILQENIEMIMTFMQGLAISPDGNFVLFTKRPVNSTEPGIDDTLQVENRDSLYFLKIDPSTGNAVGSPVLLFSADEGPVDGESDESTGDELAYPQILGIDVLKD